MDTVSVQVAAIKGRLARRSSSSVPIEPRAYCAAVLSASASPSRPRRRHRSASRSRSLASSLSSASRGADDEGDQDSQGRLVAQSGGFLTGRHQATPVIVRRSSPKPRARGGIQTLLPGARYRQVSLVNEPAQLAAATCAFASASLVLELRREQSNEQPSVGLENRFGCRSSRALRAAKAGLSSCSRRRRASPPITATAGSR